MYSFFSISFLFMMNECLQKESEHARVYLLSFLANNVEPCMTVPTFQYWFD